MPSHHLPHPGGTGVPLSALRSTRPECSGENQQQALTHLGDCSVSIGRQVVVPSDKDGGFEIGGLRPGLHAVTVYTKGKSFLRDVRAPATDVIITIE